MDPTDVVSAFIARIEAKDVPGASALLAEDVVYDNVPIGPISGKAQTAAVLEQFLGSAGAVEWIVTRTAASGPVVMNERVDRFQMGEGWLELPVAGVFEVHDGLITLWRDYFDLASYTNQLSTLTGGTPR